jgi:xylan 1,4-beta-xylosidase
MKSHGRVIVFCLFGICSAGQTLMLFSDSFDRADSPDVNAGAEANQSGTVAPLEYGSFSNSPANSVSISGGRGLLTVDGDGVARIVPQYNFSDQSLSVSSVELFEVSYAVHAGLNYTGTVHGSYASSLILAQESIAESTTTGLTNPWYGLYAKIQGNGQVTVYSQGAKLLAAVNADYGNAYRVGQENQVRVAVDTDGFTTADLNTFSLYINETLVGSADFYWKRSDDLYVALEAASYSAEFDDLQVQVPGAPSWIGTWTPFWRALPVIGEWLAGGQGMEAVNDYQKRNSFCVQTKPLATEIPFADHLNAVRLIGGWNENTGAEKPVPADEADLVYKDEFGGLQYRWDKLALRLDPYIDAGYTNLTLVLDNIPYCFTTNPVMESYGQVGAPDDFAEWHTFVSNLCVALVDLYGFETANQFRFRQGTEAQSIDRFHGTEEEYFRIYDHSAAAVKSVLPGAQFGPFNAAGGISENHNVRIAELARHCATGTNYATGEIGTPFDFIPISLYLAQAAQSQYSAAYRVDGAMDVFETVQNELADPKPYEVHEFGILTCGAGLSTDEPGARGAAWRFQMMAGLRECGLSRWYHWGVFDTFRSTQTGLHKLLKSNGWLLSVLDRTAGGETYVLNTSAPSEPDTAVKTLGVFGRDRDWILSAVYNPDRLNHSNETVSIHIPTNLLQIAEGDAVLWTSLCQTNSAHWMIRRDLEEQSMLNAAFAAVPEQLSAMRTMTTNSTTSAQQDYIAGRLDIYEQAVIDSLTLKPFPGTVVTNGGELIFTLEMTPPETAVICIGPDRTEAGIPYAWLDQYGLATGGYGAAAAGDTDGDSLSAAQEYVIQTDPLESNPPLSVQSQMSAGGLSFQTLENRLYNVYGTDSLVDPDWQPVGDPLLGTGAVETWVDPQPNGSNRFYRFELQLP